MRNNNAPPCCSEIVETEAPNVIADNDDVCSGHLRPAIRIFEQHSSKICVVGKKHLDRHKKRPRAVHAPGASTGCCLSLNFIGVAKSASEIRPYLLSTNKGETSVA